MTEAEWLAATDPTPMLDSLQGRANDRKVRLFAVACFRGLGADLRDEFRSAVEAAERFADGVVDGRRLWAAGQAAVGVLTAAACPEEEYRAGAVAWAATRYPATPSIYPGPMFPHPADRRAHADLLRCIFGNPFRPVSFDLRWRSESAVALASAIYHERAFDRMPVLADALEEAGCDNATVLAHCRGDGPHARGCWVVDGVLGTG